MSSATAGIVGAIVGALIAAGSALLVARSTRKDTLRDRLYEGRRDAYTSFLEKSHDSAHELGKLATQPWLKIPEGQARFDISYSVDGEVSPELSIVKIVGPHSVALAATHVYDSLYAFRQALSDAIDQGAPIPYSPDNESRYIQAYGPYRHARDDFVRAARTELDRLEAAG